MSGAVRYMPMPNMEWPITLFSRVTFGRGRPPSSHFHTHARRHHEIGQDRWNGNRRNLPPKQPAALRPRQSVNCVTNQRSKTHHFLDKQRSVKQLTPFPR
jgi:hypothetical protein